MAHIALQVVVTFAGVPVSRTVEFQESCDQLASFVMSGRDHVGVTVELERAVSFEGTPTVEQLNDVAAVWRARAQAVADSYDATMYWGGMRHRQLRQPATQPVAA